ncbi:hypothetical protein NQ176_g4884 [Zarea fungicola]|uniref:Uncharacterized protein n=1 Tax=Zarea fungicola TaxID=93591 RepID=A0ACC1NC12_9HYPO|nr:hypothetical protein NQ176_g4884 [Lecanicillium fungicola]
MDDSSFGPRLSGEFDFTLLFEHAFLHIVPSICMILMVPYHIYKIIKGPVLVRPGTLLWLKLSAAVAIAAIQLTSVVLWYKSPLNSPAAQAASILSFLGALGTIIIGYSSHTHFFQPIFFLAFYLIVTLLFDLVTVYSYWRRDSLHAVARLACALPPLKLILIALEEVSKRSLVVSKEAQDACTNETVAGFWNRSTFAWVNPLLLFGFRHRIKNNHLPDIGVQFDAEAKHLAFKQQWDKQDKKDKYALLKACIFSDPWPYIYIVLPRLFIVGLRVSEPFLLQDIVDTVSGSSHDNLPPQQKRTSLILAVALVFIGKAVTSIFSQTLVNVTNY